MTEIDIWLERSDYCRTGCVKMCNRWLSVWREPYGIPAAEVMTRETAGRCLKRESGTLAAEVMTRETAGRCLKRESGTPAAEVMTRETTRKWLKRTMWDSCSTSDDTWKRREVLEESHVIALQLLYLVYSLFMSLILTIFAINIHQHTSSSLYGIQYSSWLSFGRFISHSGHSHTPSTTFM